MTEERRHDYPDLIALERETQNELGDLKTTVAVLGNKVESLREQIRELVSKASFRPVQLLTYTITASILTGIITGWLSGFFVRH